MDHLEAIVEIKNIISTEFIDKIIPLINYKAKKNLEVRTGVNKHIRNVKGYHLDFTTPTNIFYWNYIKKEIERVYTFYKAKFPKMESYKINQIDLLKYSFGGKYEVHTDHYTDTARHLSIIILFILSGSAALAEPKGFKELNKPFSGTCCSASKTAFIFSNSG